MEGGLACADKQNASRDLVWSRLARPTIDASHLDLHMYLMRGSRGHSAVIDGANVWAGCGVYRYRY